jgi:DsbC/DsbD-like thiol-disulfide interchange protein
MIKLNFIRGVVITYVVMSCLWSDSANAQGDDIVKYDVQKPEDVKRGEQFQIHVLFSVVPGWYIYAPTGKNAAQGMIETEVIFSLPQGIKRDGKMKIPEPVLKNGHQVYEGKEILISQVLRVLPSSKLDAYEIKGKITWQTCNSSICLPPITEDVRIIVNVK